MNFVASKFDLKKDILFKQKVTNAKFIEDSNNWNVKTDNNNFKCKFLITAVGCLSNTNIPKIKGLKDFEKC